MPGRSHRCCIQVKLCFTVRASIFYVTTPSTRASSLQYFRRFQKQHPASTEMIDVEGMTAPVTASAPVERSEDPVSTRELRAPVEAPPVAIAVRSDG